MNNPIQVSREKFKQASEMVQSQFVVFTKFSKSPIFFLFPELIVNPTEKGWYPYLCFVVRLAMYGGFILDLYEHWDKIKEIIKTVIPFL